MGRYKTLQDFLDIVGYEDRTDRPLSRLYEPARLLKETEKREKPVLFALEGTEQHVAGNLVDTRIKLFKALGVESDEEAYKLVSSAVEGTRPPLDGFPGGYEDAKHGLMSLPAIKYYPGDAGLYLTSSIFVACKDGACNASIHRVQVIDEKKGVVRIVPRHLYSMYQDAASRGESLAVTMLIGVHPAYVLAAAYSPPKGVYELEIAARILGDCFIESPLHKHPIPRASIIVEGWLLPEQEWEGPFADILLLYDKRRRQPVFKPEKILIDKDVPSHAILSGGLEHIVLMGFPREIAIWEGVSRVVPRVHKVRLTPGGGGWLHAVISIEKNHEGDGKNAILAAFASHPSLKHVVVVDPDIDPEDPEMVEWAIATRFQADRDLVVVKHVRGSTLDPSGIEGFTSKMGIDATIKGERERYRRASLPRE